MEFTLRACAPGDEVALALVAQGTILESYAGVGIGTDLYAYANEEFGIAQFCALLGDERARLWIAEAVAGTCAVGYALVLGAGEPPFATSELKRLYLFHRFQRFGLGKRFMDAVFAHASDAGTSTMSLRVHEKNDKAMAFYRRFGFEVVGEEPFHAGESDYRVFVMERGLGLSS